MLRLTSDGPSRLIRRWCTLGPILVALLATHHAASAAAPVLLRTPGYESPVQGGPDDLLLIAGSGFKSTDRVVYESMGAADSNDSHPTAVPKTSSETRGLAPIVKLGSPPYAITVRLPSVIEADRPYRLWVVNKAGEWSRPVSINDARPLWVTPSFAYSSADLAGLNRAVRVVGRNLKYSSEPEKTASIRLTGPGTYVIAASPAKDDSVLTAYMREGVLPKRLTPGQYAVAVSGDGSSWKEIPAQKFEVRPDPPALPRLEITDPRFGTCRPNDDNDDSECIERALQAAERTGGATVAIPAGTWDVTTAHLGANRLRNGFILARNVHLKGAGANTTHLLRHDLGTAPAPGALLTLTGGNSVEDISFSDDEIYKSLAQSRAVIQLGVPWSGNDADSATMESVDDVVISGNAFLHVGRALLASGVPIRRLFVTHNSIGSFDNGLLLTGSGASPKHPYRVDESVFRENRFIPGSFVGSIASQIGASDRVDFSKNLADGTATEGLQDEHDPPGWRAAFFWNLNNNGEKLLIAENRIDCSGDKTSDGEAISMDDSGAAYAFDAAQTVAGAGPAWVSTRATLLHERRGHALPDNHYNGQWITVMAGPGVGQTRRIDSYTEDRATGIVTFRVSPAWDVVPQPGLDRLSSGPQYWQVYIVANEVRHTSPPCRKSNLSGPRGGVIAFWSPVADSAIAGNVQHDTDGIEYQQGYSAHVPSCPGCSSYAKFAMALEIRGNRIDGEYDWDSDCSWSGVRAYFVANPTPESPPPVLGFGNVIAHNDISHVDGQRGGAIQIVRAGVSGPPPAQWPMALNTLIYENTIRDVNGAPPRAQCRQRQGSTRTGIRIEGDRNARDTVLAGNRCERVDAFLEDSGLGTERVCPATGVNSCECAQH